jgi:hypothetical protein
VYESTVRRLEARRLEQTAREERLPEQEPTCDNVESGCLPLFVLVHMQGDHAFRARNLASNNRRGEGSVERVKRVGSSISPLHIFANG